MPRKYVFVTGGVSSALGKGITAASLCRALNSRGLRARPMKADPYLNADPGTMNPIEHGEVYVTHDGGETDLDLGHYERFLDLELPSSASFSSGQVFTEVLEAERRGDYLGKTVQVIPHITDAIKARIVDYGAEQDADVVVVEVGGTVGDIEGLPFLEALRQLRHEVGGANVCYVHVALVPWLPAAGELKTKPTQHSVRELRSVGIHPDVLVCRSDRPLPADVKRKIGLMCDVPHDAVISAIDAPLYEVPLNLHADGLDAAVLDRLQLTDAAAADLSDWQKVVEASRRDRAPLNVAIVGKYTGLADAYLSVIEALGHAGLETGTDPTVTLVDAETLSGPDADLDAAFADTDAVVVPGGFGDRGVEGKLAAATYARTRGVPLLGLCLGLQTVVIEYARNVAGIAAATSAEFDTDATDPVIALMDSQRNVTALGGTMRLGDYTAHLADGTLTASLYASAQVVERHRHRYEVNPAYHAALADAGLTLSGTSPDGALVEFVEISDHPFYVATQAHPEFRSSPTRPHPLFVGLLRAAHDRSR